MNQSQNKSIKFLRGTVHIDQMTGERGTPHVALAETRFQQNKA